MSEDSDDISNYDFHLPDQLIAATPVDKRDMSRLLMASTTSREHKIVQFAGIVDQLRPDDLLVFNNSRVVPARLFAKKTTGGRVELLILDVLGSHAADRWTSLRGDVRVTSMFRASKGLSAGATLTFGDQTSVIVESVEDGVATFLVNAPDGVAAWLEELGELPLPPYIVKRRLELRTEYADDGDRYQTVYADRPGSVAAPTAGLHFTKEIFEALERRGVNVGFVTLEVGPGTFRPVKAARLSEHLMHSERYHIGGDLKAQIERTRARGRRVIAVGTTSARVLESEARRSVPFEPGSRTTDIFLKPGNGFEVVDGLVTNFHLPRSTLLALVASFAGLDLVRELYALAITERMRFYSYGDAMFLTHEALA